MEEERVERLRKALKSPILIFGESNIRYFTGVPANGFLLLSKDQEIIVSRDKELAQTTGCEVVQPKGKTTDALFRILKKQKAKTVAAAIQGMDHCLVEKLSSRLKLVDCSKQVWRMREVKDRHELGKIREACRLADVAMKAARNALEPGVTERNVRTAALASVLDKCEDVAFSFIIASGENSLYTHFPPQDRMIERTDLVIADLGLSVEGYKSDLSRAFCLEPSASQEKLYRTVADAQDAAFGALREGARCKKVWSRVFSLFKQKKLDAFWKYGLGHGVGLDIHESPSLDRFSKDVLKQGMVFTVEPGLHVPGIGGVRIEDTIVLGEKPEKLTKFKYGL